MTADSTNVVNAQTALDAKTAADAAARGAQALLDAYAALAAAKLAKDNVTAQAAMKNATQAAKIANEAKYVCNVHVQ